MALLTPSFRWNSPTHLFFGISPNFLTQQLYSQFFLNLQLNFIWFEWKFSYLFALTLQFYSTFNIKLVPTYNWNCLLLFFFFCKLPTFTNTYIYIKCAQNLVILMFTLSQCVHLRNNRKLVLMKDKYLYLKIL